MGIGKVVGKVISKLVTKDNAKVSKAVKQYKHSLFTNFVNTKGYTELDLYEFNNNNMLPKISAYLKDLNATKQAASKNF